MVHVQREGKRSRTEPCKGQGMEGSLAIRQTLPEGGSPETGKCAGKRLTAQEGGSGCQTSWAPAPLSHSTSIPDMQEFMADGRVHAENYGSITASYLHFLLPLN